MPTTFYNPYQFVPAEKPNKEQKDATCTREAFRDSKKTEHVTHERYVPGKHSGRLVVRLRTVKPVVMGGEQIRKEKDFTEVRPYRAGGQVAIPGSSLRGLTSSVIEAATDGPLRVLTDRTLSYRKPMAKPLSAIGMLQMEKGELRLLPLCLPVLESKDGGRSFEAPPEYRAIFPTPQLKSLFGGAAEIRQPQFPYRTAQSPQEVAPMPMKQLSWRGNAVMADSSLVVKANRYAIGQRWEQSATPRPGLIRVLGCWGDRTDDIPTGKKHELWVPLTAGIKTLPIQQNAIDRFHELADERTEADKRLPFEPRDTARNVDPQVYGHKYRLKAGDMVYFAVNRKGEVTELAFSSIWRGRVEDSEGKATRVHAFFRHFGADVLPLLATDKERSLTLTDLLMGFVEEVPKEEKDKAKKDGEAEMEALSLASRLRFHDALPVEKTDAELLENEVRLKILSSPKLPCPSLYFQGDGGQARYIAKTDLSASQHRPNGRKWYLHGRSEGGDKPWETKKPGDAKDQKNRVRPIKAGKEFYFHIDFDNLSDVELGVLLYALEPNDGFHHKIGLGRPLGLGSVKVEVLGYFRVNREKRYSLEGLRSGRYHEAELTAAGKALQAAQKWPARYAEELGGGWTETPVLESCREVAYNGVIPERLRNVLQVLGDYANAPLAKDVRYPTLAEQKDKETEHYKWFVFNAGQRERGAGMSPASQSLKPVSGRPGAKLEPLVELERDDPPQRRW